MRAPIYIKTELCGHAHVAKGHSLAVCWDILWLWRLNPPDGDTGAAKPEKVGGASPIAANAHVLPFTCVGHMDLWVILSSLNDCHPLMRHVTSLTKFLPRNLG